MPAAGGHNIMCELPPCVQFTFIVWSCVYPGQSVAIGLQTEMYERTHLFLNPQQSTVDWLGI